MPPSKKAAKKTAKKAAKKAAGHHHDQHHQANDLRRAYEHMGRLQVLRQSLESPMADSVAELTALAQKAIKAGSNKDAADLLRASEHLSFAVLADDGPADGGLSTDLKQAIAEQFGELLRRAEEHWNENEERSRSLVGLYQGTRDSAARAFQVHAYHQALEYARAAEALTHVEQPGALKLDRGHKDLQLRTA